MAMDFPTSPTNGQTFQGTNGLTYIYNTATGWSLNLFRYAQVQANMTAVASQTSFTVPGGYAPGQIQVWKNGLKLINTIDVTVTSGTVVVLASAASAGDKIEVNGLQAFSLSAGYLRGGRTLLTSASGTYTPSSGCRAITVKIQGAAGSSGGVASTGLGESAVSSGGAAGGYIEQYITSLSASYAYTIGVGGVAPSAGANDGNAGGNSTFNGLTAGGGGPGKGGAATASLTFAAAAAGGTASGGDINIPGGASERPLALAGAQYIPSHGGVSPWMPANRNGPAINTAAVAGAIYGNGASGVCNGQSQSARAGAAGGNGAIEIIEWF